MSLPVSVISFPRVHRHTQAHRPVASCTMVRRQNRADSNKTTNSHDNEISNTTTNRSHRHTNAFTLVSVVHFSLTGNYKLFYAWAQRIIMQIYDRAG